MAEDRVIDSFKKICREIKDYKRFDIEVIDKELEREKKRYYGDGFYVEYGGKYGFEINWDKRFRGGEVSSKERCELWKVLNMDENEVLNCGKIGEGKIIGLGCSCVCVHYNDGKEYWDLSDYWWYGKFVGGEWRKD